MFPAAEPLRVEYGELERRLGDPQVHADPVRAQRLGRRYAELMPVMASLVQHERLVADLTAARELAAEDSAFAAEVQELEERVAEVADRLTELLVPSDPNDARDVIMEIKSGEGGEESALFAADLLRMYTRLAERRGWTVTELDSQGTDLGGWKSVTIAVRAPAAAATTPYATLKFEGGVHRVQRIPVTESQGRVHTSAAGVLVMPEVEADEVEVREADLRIDVFRASGPGGQGVNTTDSAVRITHLPTGVVVSCQNERSQLQNREQALRMLRARLVALADEDAARSASDARRRQVQTVDRSMRIRTYNFPENRIADHRIGFKAHNLDAVLAGELDPLLAALHEADRAERLGRQEHAGNADG